jgi:hypothetical protein
MSYSMSRMEGLAWYSSLDPRLLSGDITPPFPPLYVSS